MAEQAKSFTFTFSSAPALGPQLKKLVNKKHVTSVRQLSDGRIVLKVTPPNPFLFSSSPATSPVPEKRKKRRGPSYTERLVKRSCERLLNPRQILTNSLSRDPMIALEAKATIALTMGQVEREVKKYPVRTKGISAGLRAVEVRPAGKARIISGRAVYQKNTGEIQEVGTCRTALPVITNEVPSFNNLSPIEKLRLKRARPSHLRPVRILESALTQKINMEISAMQSLDRRDTPSQDMMFFSAQDLERSRTTSWIPHPFLLQGPAPLDDGTD